MRCSLTSTCPAITQRSASSWLSKMLRSINNVTSEHLPVDRSFGTCCTKCFNSLMLSSRNEPVYQSQYTSQHFTCQSIHCKHCSQKENITIEYSMYRFAK